MSFIDAPLPLQRPALFWIALLSILALALSPQGAGLPLLTDKGLHFGAFATLAVIGAMTGAMPPSRRALVFWAFMALAIEVAQEITPTGRDGSKTDVVASFAGAFFGMALARAAPPSTFRRLAVAGAVVLAATVCADLGYRALRDVTGKVDFVYADRSSIGS